MGLVCCQESANSTGAGEKQALAMANIKALEAQRVAAEGLAKETRNELDAKIAGARVDEQQRREQAKLKSVEPLTEKGKLSFEELTGMKFRNVDTGSPLHQAVAAAREAQRLEKMGERERLLGHDVLASQLFRAGGNDQGWHPAIKRGRQNARVCIQERIGKCHSVE